MRQVPLYPGQDGRGLYESLITETLETRLPGRRAPMAL